MKNFLKTKFADPTVDFAFKRIFGSEQYKKATIGLLNSIITDRNIVDVTFPNTELLGDTSDSRNVFVDVLAEDIDGTKFLVEMQNARQSKFRQRTLFYASKLITASAQVGRDWDYGIDKVYVVAIVNFDLDGLSGYSPVDGSHVRSYKTRDERSGELLPDSPEFYFLEVKNFNKSVKELKSNPEKWLYLLRNAAGLDAVPEEFQGNDAFHSFFDASNRAGFTKEEDFKYTEDMVNAWDRANEKREAREEGRAEGREEGRAEGRAEGREESRRAIAKSMLADGLDISLIAKYTALTEEELTALKIEG